MFGVSEKPSKSGELLSEPSEHPASFVREASDYHQCSDRFKLKKKEFQRQYAHLYTERLLTCRSKVVEAVKEKWGKCVLRLFPYSPIIAQRTKYTLPGLWPWSNSKFTTLNLSQSTTLRTLCITLNKSHFCMRHMVFRTKTKNQVSLHVMKKREVDLG